MDRKKRFDFNTSFTGFSLLLFLSVSIEYCRLEESARKMLPNVIDWTDASCFPSFPTWILTPSYKGGEKEKFGVVVRKISADPFSFSCKWTGINEYKLLKHPKKSRLMTMLPLNLAYPLDLFILLLFIVVVVRFLLLMSVLFSKHCCFK